MKRLTSFRSLEAAKPETSNPTVRRVTRCAMTQTKRTQLNETRKKGNPPTGLSPDGRGRNRDGRPKKDPPERRPQTEIKPGWAKPKREMGNHPRPLESGTGGQPKRRKKPKTYKIDDRRLEAALPSKPR